MKRLRLLVLVAVFCGELGIGKSQVFGQATPRAPLIPVSRGSSAAPDPSGIYEGPVTLTLGGQTSSQTWRAEVQAQPCPDCDSGLYYLDATTFTAIEQSNGNSEKGGIRGFFAPSGTLEGLTFSVANCPFIEANGKNNIAVYYGGNFGVPGTKLTIEDGVLSGSVSGSDCFGKSFTATVSLSKVSSGPILSCVRGAETIAYSGTFANSCGGRGSGSLQLVRSGCIIGAVIPGVAAIEATMTGPTTFDAVVKPLGCAVTATGSGTIHPDGSIVGNYSGQSAGGLGCCPAGPFTGTFTLTLQQP
jgi:hypothetical protein